MIHKILHMCIVLTLVFTLGCSAVRKTKSVYHEAVSEVVSTGKTAVKVALLAAIIY